jgi:PAS domain S-box-containing protein
MNRLGIIPKLTLIFVLFAALLLAVVSLLAYTSGRSALQTAAVSELLSAAIDKQAALDAWIGEAQVHATAIAASPYLQVELMGFQEAQRRGEAVEARAAHDRLDAELRIWAGEEKDYQVWMIMDPDSGQVIAASDASEEGKYRNDQAYFINGKSGPYVQNVYYSLAAQGTRLTVSTPIRAADGIVLGVLAGNLELEKMNEIVSRRTGLRQSDDAYLVNTSELFVTQPRFLSDPAVLRLGVHTEAVKQCLRRNSGVVTAVDYRGTPAMIVYRWLPERQLCLIVKMDQAEALAPALALRNNILLMSVLALFAASFLAFWLARTITRPLQQLAEAAQEIGSGKLETRIEVKTRDEIGQLAGAFVQMTENLQKTLVSRDDLLAEIAERKKAEETLRQSEKKYRHLFQNAQVGMYRSKLDGSAILAVNQKLCEIFGFSEEEMIDNPATIRWANPAARDRMVTELRRTGTLHDYEMGILTKNGEARTCLVSISLNPELGFLEGSAIDVTERKRMEQDLRVKDHAIESAQSPLAISDLAGHLTYINPAFLSSWGYAQRQDVLGRSTIEFWQMGENAAEGIQALQEGKPWSGEMAARRKDGTLFEVEVGASMIVDQTNQPLGMMATFKDITERKRAEEALKKTHADLERSNTDLEQFAYVASHDLQEPLRMVSSFTQLLGQRYKGKLDGDADEFIGFAVDGANHMQRLINDLLTFSRIGTRGQLPEAIPSDTALDRALDNLKLAIEESQAVVEREPLPTVAADDVQLIQVFQNLIANAIKFRGDEPPRIRIAAEARGKEWVFSVRDNGIGIDPQYLERIFIIFQRLHERGKYPGTGIGLAICKKIVQRHGGRIWVESEPGKGSTFYFSLPKTGGN